MKLPRFQVGSGSAPGYYHWRGYRNNQDAVFVGASDHGLVALVSDGCSQGAHSEVGAQLMSRFIVHRTLHMLACNQDDRLWDLNDQADRRLFLDTLQRASEHYLNSVICGLGGDRIQTIQSLFLFTILGAVVTPTLSFVFGQGDGVYQINDDYTAIDENNQPHYLGYKMLPKDMLNIEQEKMVFHEHASIATKSLRFLVLGTDGADVLQVRAQEKLKDGTSIGGLQQFAKENRYVEQHTAINRRLNVINVINRKVHDDTSLIVIKREGEENE